MSYRDELAAAHARIEGLERQLASTEQTRESDATRLRSEAALARSQELSALGEELRAVKEELREQQQVLAAERSNAAMARVAAEAHQESQRLVHEAERHREAAVLKATQDLVAEHVIAAAREREAADRELEELAGLSRGAALRLYQQQLAQVTAEREKLAAGRGAAPSELRPDASIEEQIRIAMAQRELEMKQAMDAQLAASEARLARLCGILAQPPRD